jgi:hypothetical protein
VTAIAGRAAARARSALVVVVVAAALTLLSACAGVPTSGPVQRGEPVVEEPGPIFPITSSGPASGDSAADIVKGFLRAQASGFSDDLQFGVAREFLSESVRNKWDPLKGALIYTSASSPDIQLTGANVVRLEVVLAGKLEPGGQFAEDSGASRGIGFGLEKDASGQWRISKLDDGLVLSKSDFDNLLTRITIYFPSSDGNYLVPDVRWFANRSVPTQAVRAILVGPSDFLRGTVRKVTPDGAKLSSDAVTVTDGIAEVNLSAEEKAAPPADRALLKAQLATVFQQVPKIQAVRIKVGGVELTTPDPPLLVGEPTLDPLPWGFVEGRLVHIQGTPPAPVAVPGVNLSTVVEPSEPAIGYGDGGAPIFVLSQAEVLMYVPKDGTPPRSVYSTGRGLVPPSVDRFGWVWTAETQSSGAIVARLQDGTSAPLLIPTWLDGRLVQSLRVSRDGSRMVVLSTSPVGGVEVDVVGIQRQNGAPQKLGDPLRIGATLTGVVAVAWVDEASVAVLGRTEGSPDKGVYIVPIGGPALLVLSRPDAVGLAVGRGLRALYLATADGRLYLSNSSSGSPLATGFTYPTLQG